MDQDLDWKKERKESRPESVWNGMIFPVMRLRRPRVAPV